PYTTLFRSRLQSGGDPVAGRRAERDPDAGKPLRDHPDRPHPLRQAGRAGAHLVQRQLLVPRRVRRRLGSGDLLRPREPGDRAAVRLLREEPGGGHARGLLKKAASGVHAVVGTDAHLADEALEKLLAAAVGAERGEAVEVLRGDETTWARLSEAARTGSLF